MAFGPNMLGPCELTYKGTAIGQTYGGVRFAYQQATAEAKYDKDGDTPISEVITGTTATVVSSVTDATLEQLLPLVPGAALRGASTKGLALRNPVGTDLVSSAGILLLKPIEDGVAVTAEDEWIYVPKAGVKPQFDVQFTLNDQKVWQVEFRAYPVTAADVASGGVLAAEDYLSGDLVVLGKATT